MEWGRNRRPSACRTVPGVRDGQKLSGAAGETGERFSAPVATGEDGLSLCRTCYKGDEAEVRRTVLDARPFARFFCAGKWPRGALAHGTGALAWLESRRLR